MAEEVELEKKKVYVETTVISDATALPTNESLEEIWRIKREIASEYPTLEDYFKVFQRNACLSGRRNAARREVRVIPAAQTGTGNA